MYELYIRISIPLFQWLTMDRLKSIFHYGFVLLFVCSVVYKFEHNLIRPFAYLFELSLYILTHFSFTVFDLSEVSFCLVSLCLSLFTYVHEIIYCICCNCFFSLFHLLFKLIWIIFYGYKFQIFMKPNPSISF